MSLAFEALRFVQRAYQNPSDASNPALLERLKKSAENAWEGIVALHAPASPMTWQSRAMILGAVQQTNRVSFRFPRPVEIVGFLPILTVIPSDDDTLQTPSTDVIDVQIDTDNQNYMTNSSGVSSNAGNGSNSSPFVVLSGMSVQVPRIVGYKLRTPTPDIGFTYRWTLSVADGAIYNDCLISMVMYARYL